MNKIKMIILAAGLPLLVQAAEVVRFDAKVHVATNSPNQRYYFALDLSAPVVSQSAGNGYSGPDVYGAMDMMEGAYWRVAMASESGLSVRMNHTTGNWVNGLFLMPVEPVPFSAGFDTMQVSDILTSQIQRLTSATVRFVIRADGKFYISEASPEFCRGGEGHQTDAFVIQALQAEWFNYDPAETISHVSIIGTPASPRFRRIDFVGFVLFAKGAESEQGVNFGVRSFSVTAGK